MINKILLLIFMIFLGGCATYSTMMVNPKTGEVYDCHASGVFLIGLLLAQSENETCVEQLREIGFEPLEENKKDTESVDE